MKKIRIFAIILLCMLVTLSLTACVEHIEDTNGDDNFSLETITDSDIESGVISTVIEGESKQTVVNKTTYKVKKLSGIKKLEEFDVIKSFTITSDMTVSAGNCRLVLLKNSKIFKDLNINGSERLTFDGGSYSLVVAGESAELSLTYTITIEL